IDPRATSTRHERHRRPPDPHRRPPRASRARGLRREARRPRGPRRGRRAEAGVFLRRRRVRVPRGQPRRALRGDRPRPRVPRARGRPLQRGVLRPPRRVLARHRPRRRRHLRAAPSDHLRHAEPGPDGDQPRRRRGRGLEPAEVQEQRRADGARDEVWTQVVQHGRVLQREVHRLRGDEEDDVGDGEVEVSARRVVTVYVCASRDVA
ncbi:uncharacterized protein MICPUCDRAFT_47694, partial [Micromonas pusilla CCMP1545]